MAIAIMVPALCVVPLLPLYAGEVSGMLALGAFAGGFFGAGYAGVTPMMLATLFPAEVRARATGIVYHVGAFGAAFVPMAMTAIASSSGVSMGTVMMYTVALFQLALVGLLNLRPKELRAQAQRSAPGFGARAESQIAASEQTMSIIALRCTVVTLALTGLAYPLVVTGLAQTLFPAQAKGSLARDGQGTWWVPS